MTTTIENSRIHQRKLRLLFNETNTTFNELITTDKSVTLHDATLPGVVTEMFIVKKAFLQFEFRTSYLKTNTSLFSQTC